MLMILFRLLKKAPFPLFKVNCLKSDKFTAISFEGILLKVKADQYPVLVLQPQSGVKPSDPWKVTEVTEQYRITVPVESVVLQRGTGVSLIQVSQ